MSNRESSKQPTCIRCFKVDQQLASIVNDLLNSSLVREPPGDDSLEWLARYVKTLKNKSFDVEQARQKVTSDVEKLIKNQETFEKRVSEMD